jgi:hypothetical protein
MIKILLFVEASPYLPATHLTTHLVPSKKYPLTHEEHDNS